MTRTAERLQGDRLQRHLFRDAARRDREEIERHHLGASACRQKASSASTSTAGPNLKEAEPKVELVYVHGLRRGLQAPQGGQGRRLPDRRDGAARHRAAGRPSGRLPVPPRFHRNREMSAFALKKGDPRFKEAINRALLDDRSDQARR